MPSNAEYLQTIAAAYMMDSTERADGLREAKMHLGDAEFPVLLGYNKLPQLVAELKKMDMDRVFLGYDENTVKHCGPRLEAELERQGIPFYRCVMGLTEQAKNMASLDNILETFLKGGGSRKTVVMPVGGGIVANTFGLAAGLLFRGIRLVQCPTSFLNAHDAAASSQKQAINHSGYKNIVGLYHLPTMALIDTSFYETLGVTELKAGLGELTKNAALFGGRHYELMMKTTMSKGTNLSGEDLVEATYIGLGAKDMLLRHDPKEKHLALLFEYGHTVGHALELSRGVHTSHGEGVTIGMLAASYIANRMGIMSDQDREIHDALVIALDPKIVLPGHDITDEVLEKVMHDNKRGYLIEKAGFCPFILNQRVGEMHAPNKYYLEYVPVPLVRETIVYVVQRMRDAMEAGTLKATLASSSSSHDHGYAHAHAHAHALTKEGEARTFGLEKFELGREESEASEESEESVLSHAPTKEKDLNKLGLDPNEQNEQNENVCSQNEGLAKRGLEPLSKKPCTPHASEIAMAA